MGDRLLPLLRPLRFAARRDFANLGVVKGLERTLSAALDQGVGLDPALAERVAGAIVGLDARSMPDKKACIRELLGWLEPIDEASDAPAEPTSGARPSRSAPPGRTPVPAPPPQSAASRPSRSPSAASRPSQSPSPSPSPASRPSQSAASRPSQSAASPPSQLAASRPSHSAASRPSPSPSAASRSSQSPSAASASPEPASTKIAHAAPKIEAKRTGKRVKMADAEPATALSEVVGVGPKTAERLGKKNLHTVQDALFFLPRRYEDRTSFRAIRDLAAGDRVSVQGEILMTTVRPAGRGKRVFEMAVSDGTGTLSCRFFRFYQSQMESRYPRGTRVVVSGAVSQWGAMRQMVHPEVELLGDDGAQPEGMVPVYTDIEGVPHKKLRTMLFGLAQVAAARIEDPMPPGMRRRLDLPELGGALLRAHCPGPEDEVEGGLLQVMRRRLVFDELLYLQLALASLQQKRDLQPGLTSESAEGWRALATRMLPFELTGAQQRALEDITGDLATPTPMNRLLQGDVGSGKTAVAFVAAAVVHEAGRQTALLAPTEILAEQHFANARRLLEPLGVRVALLTGSTKTSERRGLLSQLRAGELHVLFGTHAILEPGVVFHDLGLAIIDEQHRFGVEQRAELKNKREGAMPDVLVMTATPIPRTLALTAYGDLRVTVIDELPPGRSPTETRIFGPSQAAAAVARMEAELDSGRQAYVVFPLIDASDKLQLKAATEEVAALKARLPNFKVALLHGRMRPDDKAEVMRGFTAGEVDVLASTTVIEVGVDVANATVMMIENAERFGLSQLHQLRGRVGRGEHRGRCLLIAGSVAAEAMERLAVLESSHDGFVVAERDLEIRGPGEMLGTRQSGLPDLVLADLVRDARVVEAARDEAFRILAEDPELADPAHAAMKRELARRFRGRMDLASVG